MSTEPVTHLEQVVAGTTTPVTHLEQVVAGTATPVTHLEHVISENSGGGSATLIEKTVTQNGVYNASDDSADGYSKVTANVPNSYAAGDEGKVVSSGALVAQISDTVTSNGTVDTTLINSLTVNVQGREKTLTKLADVTITEPVRVVEITVTEAIRSCQMFYFVNSGVVFSEDDWLAYIINGAVFYCKQKRAAQPDFVRPYCIVPACTINGVSHNAEPMASGVNNNDVYIYTGSPRGAIFNSGITSLKIGTHGGNADITAGHFEIWGWV